MASLFEYSHKSIVSRLKAAADSTLDAESWDKLVTKCVIYFKAAEFEKALDVCILLTAQAPNDDNMLRAGAKHNLGSALHALGSHEAAGLLYIESYNLLELEKKKQLIDEMK